VIGPGTVNSVFEAFAEGFATGLTGILGVTIDDGEGNNVVPRTTEQILEIQTVGTDGVYRFLGTYPGEMGTYLLTWDDGTLTASEDLVVGAENPAGPPDPAGPCGAWIDGEDITACCGIEAVDQDTLDRLEAAAAAASDLLFALSGRLYRGTCGPVTVRPCSTGRSCYVPGRSDLVQSCGCAPLSTWLLPGYPVTEIAQVLLDGQVIAPSEYRLDEQRKLVRLADVNGKQQFWPACQRLDLPDTEERTASVTYFYGVAPPALGEIAAAKLGCEIYRACSGAGAGECAIPSDAVRVTRQGITIEKAALSTWIALGAYGIPEVGAFMAAYGNHGATRRPAVWSPDGPKYAKQLGGA
jgi:hypothetical protein